MVRGEGGEGRVGTGRGRGGLGLGEGGGGWDWEREGGDWEKEGRVGTGKGRKAYLVYSSSNFAPHTSARPGHSSGHIRDQFPLLSTLFMKRSGIHRA